MTSIILTRTIRIDGTGYTAGSTVAVSAEYARTLVGDGAARWLSVAAARHLSNRCNDIPYFEDITSLTGGAPAGLNGFLLGGVTVGRMFDVVISPETTPRRYRVITKNGETPDGDSIIEPPDFDADAPDNNKLLLRIS